MMELTESQRLLWERFAALANFISLHPLDVDRFKEFAGEVGHLNLGQLELSELLQDHIGDHQLRSDVALSLANELD